MRENIETPPIDNNDNNTDKTLELPTDKDNEGNSEEHAEENVNMENEENNYEIESSFNSDTENTGVDTEIDIPIDLSRITEANNERIKEIEQEMDHLYGTRIRSNLRQHKQRISIPRKFRYYEGDLHTLTSERMNLK